MFEVGDLGKTVLPLHVRIFYVNNQKSGISQEEKGAGMTRGRRDDGMIKWALGR